MHIDSNHYHRSLGTMSKLRLVAVAKLTHYAHVAVVVLVVPTLVHRVDVDFFVLVLTGGVIAMIEPVIHSNDSLIYLVDF